jgi:hypothetical protein
MSELAIGARASGVVGAGFFTLPPRSIGTKFAKTNNRSTTSTSTSPLRALLPLTVVPSGLANVGVKILYGTVIPDFGLCGGGVEVFFPEGTAPGTVSDAKEIPEK